MPRILKNSSQKWWRHFLQKFWQNAQMLKSRVSVSNFKSRVTVSEFLMKSRSRLEIVIKSRSRRLRSRLHHWLLRCYRVTRSTATTGRAMWQTPNHFEKRALWGKLKFGFGQQFRNKKISTFYQWRSQPKNLRAQKILGRGKLFDFRRITLFCLEKCLSKHKITIRSIKLGEGHSPFGLAFYRQFQTNW